MAGQSVDLVFEGGGVKGIGLAGALVELERQGYQPRCVAGTSAGAIMASLVAAGYARAELQEVVLHQMDFARFEDPPRLAVLGSTGEALDILKDKGIHSGDYFLHWIRDLLAAKGVHAFADLRDDTATDERRRYRLQVIASDLTDEAMLVLPRDAARIGFEPDALPVAEAVRMSMSIPVFFVPWEVKDAATGRTHMIVDGGLLSNYPVWLFDAPVGTTPSFPTLGLLLVTPNARDPMVPNPSPDDDADTASPVGYIKAVIETMLMAHDRFYVEDEDFARTIPIPTLGISTTDFSITPERAQALFQSGQDAAAAFLKTWDFEAYLAKYRTAPA
jgi:NTE family protein